MKLVVIIPALNEEATIADVVRRVPRDIDRIDAVEVVEVVVVDDGSSDATADHARDAGATVVSHPRNEGVGVAFATGVATALERGADLVVNMDGDGQFRPEDIPALIEPIFTEHAGFVTCTRFADPRLVPRMTAVKRWGNAWMTRLIAQLCSTDKFTDVSCGFRAYTRDTLLRLNLYGRYTYTQETFINLAAHKVHMVEVPLQVRGIREFGTSRVAGSILKYIRKTVPIIFRTLRDVRPFAFFGSISAVVLMIGLLFGGFVFGHWLATGRTQPYQSLLIASAVGIMLGFLLLVVALLADMMNRLRKLLEQLLFFARRRHYDEIAWPSTGEAPPIAHEVSSSLADPITQPPTEPAPSAHAPSAHAPPATTPCKSENIR